MSVGSGPGAKRGRKTAVLVGDVASSVTEASGHAASHVAEGEAGLLEQGAPSVEAPVAHVNLEPDLHSHLMQMKVQFLLS